MTPPTHNRSGLIVRVMQPADLGFADSLRALAGWNQTPRDWQRLLSLGRGGCFIAERQGIPAGTVTTICYGPELGWVGMLLVHPDHRRGGLGSALLQSGLEHLETMGAQCVRLDATPLGQPLYERFGFQPEWSLTRWEAASPARPIQPTPLSLCRVSPGDLEFIVALDQQAFGLARGQVLTEFLGDCLRAVICKGEGGSTLGYGMLRGGSRALYLGPVTADTSATAEVIIRHLLHALPGQPVFWDVPDLNQPASALAKALGFKAQRPLLRMRRGDTRTPAEPRRQFGILDPALG